MMDPEKNSGLTHMISPYSISVYGDTAGHSCISDNALLALSYNVTYRLYEILKECKTEMNVYRQSSLSNVILNNVFQTYGIPSMLGNKTHATFVNVPNTDISVLHLPKVDLETEAANNTLNVHLELEPFVKGLYISPLLEISNALNVEDIKLEPNPDLNEPQSSQHIAPNNQMYELKQTETDYFLVVSQIILNASENLFKILLEDLRTNPRLGGVFHTILNFLGNSIKYFSCVGKLTDRLLRTIDALLDNPHFDPSSSYCVDNAINSLTMLILESKIANDSDDFPYRRRASSLLMRALNIWNITAENREQILNTLSKTLESPEKMSLKLNYSILMMLCGLGCDVLDSHFWPSLDRYLNVLSSFDEIISGKRSFSLTTEICHVKSVLLLVSGILYRNFWIENESVQLLHFRVDTLLHAYFGEAIAPIRIYSVPRVSPLFVFKARGRSQNEELVTVGRKNYQKMHVLSLCQKYPTKYVPIRSTRHHHNINNIFETNLPCKRNTRIIFNFIGSNQIRCEQLRVKKIDQRYNVRCTHSSRPFLKYEKVTRCIKHCKTRPSCVGDIHLSV